MHEDAISVGFNTQNKFVTTNDIITDISSSSGRMIQLEHVKVTVGPIFYGSGFTNNMANVFTIQLFGVSVAGVTFPLCAAKPLSFTNPTTVRGRIPEWLLGPQDIASGNSLFLIQVRCTTNLVTNAFEYGCVVDTRGRITNPQVNTF
jgi:hypothetical protein